MGVIFQIITAAVCQILVSRAALGKSCALPGPPFPHLYKERLISHPDRPVGGLNELRYVRFFTQGLALSKCLRNSLVALVTAILTVHPADGWDARPTLHPHPPGCEEDTLN